MSFGDAMNDDSGMEGRRRSSNVPVNPETNIGSAIDRIDNALENLQEAIERNRMKIDPVTDNTRRSDDESDNAPSAERMGSAIQQALHDRADRIVRITNQLRDVNDRIDL